MKSSSRVGGDVVRERTSRLTSRSRTRFRSSWSTENSARVASICASCTPGSVRSPYSGRAVSTRTVVRVRWRSSRNVPESAVRPARTIVTRSQSASTSESTWLDRRTVLPAACASAHALLEDGGHERVEARRRFVQQVQLGVGGEGRDQCDLLAVALGVGAALLGRIEPEPLDQAVPARPVQAAAKGTEQVDHLAAGEVGPQADLAGDVREAPVQGGRVAPRIEVEDGGARRRPCPAARAGCGAWSSCRLRSAPGSRAPRPARTCRSSRSRAW